MLTIKNLSVVIGSIFLILIIFLGFNYVSDSNNVSIISQSQLAQVAVPTSAQVAYWSFDEGSGSSAADSSGGNTATLTNASWTSGKIGNAVSFSGSGSYANAGNGSGLNFGTGSFSVSFWINPSALPASTGGLVTKMAGNYATGWYTSISSTGTIWFYARSGVNTYGKVISSSPVSIGQWHHITGVVDQSGAMIHLYIDGVENGSPLNISGFGSIDAVAPMLMGAVRTDTSFYNGSIDDVRIYNRTLSVGEISQLYSYVGGTTVTTPPATPITCTSFTYSAWSICSNGSQTQTVTSSLPAGCTGGTPITTQSCTVSITTYTITSSAGANGSISPTAVVNSGASQSFTITPATGYQIASVLVDGVSMGAVSSYTFSNVTAGHTISASFSIIPVVVTPLPPAPAPASGNIYIAQTTQGLDTGADATNAHSVAWLNTSSNWATSGIGKITPGTVVHLSGTISTPINILASGTAGNPITIYFESGAKISMPSIPTTGAITLGSNNYITIDGGTNGIIENTANGTGMGQVSSRGISGTPNIGNITIKNITIQNLYVRTNMADQVSPIGIYLYGVVSNILVQNSSFTWAHQGVALLYGVGNSYNFQVTGSHFNHINHGTIFGSGNNGGAILTNAVWSNNQADYFAEWDNPGANAYHHNGFYAWADHTGAEIHNITVANNIIGGHFGNSSYGTSGIYLSAAPGNGIFNLLLANNVISFLTGGANDGAIYLFNVKNSTIANNTLYDASGMYNGVRLDPTTSNVNFYNNIFSGFKLNYYLVPGATTKPTISNYNLYSGIGSFRVDGAYNSLTAWKALGYDTNAIVSDPLLVSPNTGNFTLGSGSSAIGSGTNLSTLFSTDINGNARPNTGSWTVGAYQYGGTVNPNPIVNNTPTASLSASPTSITSGQSSTLNWSSTNSTSCIATRFTASGTSGSVVVTPTANTTYSITCTGAGGTSAPSSITVSVGTVVSTGSILTKLVGSDFGTVTAPTGVVSKIDTSATTATNPVTTASLSVANHTISATDVSGYTESYGVCTYAIGGTECSMSTSASYSTTGLTCSAGFCSVSTPVTANMVTKVVFKYDAIVVNTPPATNPPASSGNPNTYTPTSGGAGPGGGGAPSAGNTTSSTTTQQIISKTPVVFPSEFLSLTLGSRNEAVKRLQIFLNNNGFQIATRGPGSKGQETNYFGNLTLQALNRYKASLKTPSVINTQVIKSNTTSIVGTFTRSLTLGSVGPDVKNLQIFLNSKGFTVSTTGIGSVGQESNYFGIATQKALIKFQEYYAKDILIPNNLTKGTGYFGPATIRKVNDIL